METTYSVQHKYSEKGRRFLVGFKQSGRPVVTDLPSEALRFDDHEEAREIAKLCQRYTNDNRWIIGVKRTVPVTDEIRAKVAARRAERKRNG